MGLMIEARSCLGEPVPSGSPVRPSLSPWLQGSLLVVLILLAYQPSWHAALVWDDDVLITANPAMQSPTAPLDFWLGRSMADYYPVTWTLCWILFKLFGVNAVGYHVVNIALHAVGVLLGWRVLDHLGVRHAWLVAAVYALHPMLVPSVTWVSEIKNTLSLVLYAASGLCWLRSEPWPPTGRTHRAWYAASLLCFLAALLSKASGILLPVVLLAWAWWRKGRLERADVMRAVPFVVLAVPFVFVTTWFQFHRAMGGVTVQPESMGLRVLAVGPAFWFYFWRLLVPVDLMMVYPFTKATVDVGTILADLALVGVTVILWRFRHRGGQGAWAAFLCASAMLAPVLGLFDMNFLRFSRVSDHFAYLAAWPILALYVGALVVAIEGARAGTGGHVAAGAPQAASTGTARGRAMALGALGVAILAVLFVVTWNRQQAFASEETFWREVVRRNPTAAVGWLNLGYSVAEKGRPGEAIGCYQHAADLGARDAALQFNWGRALHLLGDSKGALGHYRAAIEIDPKHVQAHLNLGVELETQGQDDDAIRAYWRAVELNPAFPAAYNNLGVVLVRRGRLVEASRCYVSALKIRPDFTDAMNNLGKLLADDDKPDEALPVLRRALELRPDFVAAWNNLGEALARMHRYDDAEAAYKKALSLQPKYAVAINNLGLVHQRKGDIQGAMACYIMAIRVDPDYVLALNNQAWVQATCREARWRNGPQALLLARRAVELTGERDALTLDTLAAALAEVGEYADAVTVASSALALARQGRDRGLERAVSKRVALYREGRPFRD